MPLLFSSDDITKIQADAIVNTANSKLQAGGGVCGAVFRAAGYAQMQEACNAIGCCDVGSVVLTDGFALPAKYVIHTVGPQYQKEYAEKADYLLGRCYEVAINLARRMRMKSIAFPLISSGKHGYPKEEALRIAVNSILSTLDYYHIKNDMDVILCLRNPELQKRACEIQQQWEGYRHETSNLEFKRIRIQFYPEDVAKMENMTLEEKIRFKQKLKAENRYISLDDPYDIATR